MAKLNLELPSNQAEWDQLAPVILRTHMTLAGMNYVDLAERLGQLGMKTDNKALSTKMRIGKFSATFFLRALIACGVQEVTLPASREGNQKMQKHQ